MEFFMETQYRLRIAKKGTSKEVIQRILYGKGELIKIDGSEFYLRESGRSSYGDEKAQKARDLVIRNLGKDHTYAEFIPESELKTDKEIKESRYYVNFSLAEEIPDNDEGNHEYRIINGKRFRLDFACGDPSLKTAKEKRKILVEMGLQEIRSRPDFEDLNLKLSIKKTLVDKIIEWGDNQFIKRGISLD